MSTVVLSIVGNAIAPGIGGIIGAAAGAYLDQAFIMPALFPTKTQNMSAGRVSEIELQSSCEGSPINRCYGSEVRCSGTCIWVSDLIEVKKTEDAGGGKGGGGGGPEITTYSYFVDIAIAICKGPKGSVARIWADGKLLFTNEGTYTEARPTEGNIVPVGKQMDIVYDSDSVLPEFTVGKTVGVAGYGIYEENEGPFILSRMFVDSSNMTHLRLKNPNAVAQALVTGQTIISQAAFEIPTGSADSLTFYLGDDNNVPDPTIEAYMGVGNVPNFNGICYVVMHKLKLTDYGNRIPNFSFLVREAEGSPG
jgi:hypothetical protein